MCITVWCVESNEWNKMKRLSVSVRLCVCLCVSDWCPQHVAKLLVYEEITAIGIKYKFNKLLETRSWWSAVSAASESCQYTSPPSRSTLPNSNYNTHTHMYIYIFIYILLSPYVKISLTTDLATTQTDRQTEIETELLVDTSLNSLNMDGPSSELHVLLHSFIYQSAESATIGHTRRKWKSAFSPAEGATATAWSRRTVVRNNTSSNGWGRQWEASGNDWSCLEKQVNDGLMDAHFTRGQGKLHSTMTSSPSGLVFYIRTTAEGHVIYITPTLFIVWRGDCERKILLYTLININICYKEIKWDGKN